MIPLKSSITITPAYKGAKSITLNQIDYSVVYDNSFQSASAFIKVVGVKLNLWNSTTKPSYEGIGQFTDADVDSRIKELLNFKMGNDAIASAILALYPQTSKKS